MKKPTNRKPAMERPNMTAYKLLYERTDKPLPKATTQPPETPPPQK